MQEIEPGHKYSLNSLDGNTPNILVFVQRVGEKYPGNSNAHPGTTSQEVLRALLKRISYVDEQQPCWQNKFIWLFLSLSFYLLEQRHYHKHSLGIPRFENLHLLATCPKCGHTRCNCK